VLDIFISPLVVLGLMMLFVVAAWTLRIYAIPRGLSGVAQMAHIRAERSMEMQEKALELAEQSLKKQDEIIRLLRQLIEDRGHFKSTQS